MGSSPAPPPPPPDPIQTANAQEGANVGAATAQTYLNDTNQYTPYGNIIYTQTGERLFVPGINGQGGNWVPQFQAKTTLSPELQALTNTNIANSQGAADIQGGLGPSATSAYLDKLGRAELDPQIAQQKMALDQQLADQGLTPGSAGWNYQQGQFGLNSAQAYNNLYLQGQNAANTALEAQYNEPINALSALKSQSQVSQPGVGTLAPTASAPIAPPNYAQIVQNNQQDALQAYQAQLQSSNAMTSGLFGLGGSLISGAASLFSDRDAKTDIEPLGKDPNTGLMMHAYRYKGDPKTYPKTVGPMADEVQDKAPGAVRSIGGHQVIDIQPGVRFGLGG
jgi:hypothetical protein